MYKHWNLLRAVWYYPGRIITVLSDTIIYSLTIIFWWNVTEEGSEGGLVTQGGLVRVVDIPRETSDLTLTGDVTLPQGQVILAARDDTAEYDDHDAASAYKDDPQ